MWEMALAMLLVILVAYILAVGALAMAVALLAAEHFGLKRGKRPAEEGAGEGREERSGKMDEGFENLMTFSVKGKNGFETGDE